MSGHRQRYFSEHRSRHQTGHVSTNTQVHPLLPIVGNQYSVNMLQQRYRETSGHDTQKVSVLGSFQQFLYRHCTIFFYGPVQFHFLAIPVVAKQCPSWGVGRRTSPPPSTCIETSRHRRQQHCPRPLEAIGPNETAGSKLGQQQHHCIDQPITRHPRVATTSFIYLPSCFITGPQSIDSFART